MPARSYIYWDGDTFTRHGFEFTVTHPCDDSGDAPWERCDGHGPVSDWTRRDKRPGERILCEDRGSHRFYDWQAACKLARTEGWNAKPYDAPNQIERAVRADFDRLRDWCNDRWQYLGVVVTLKGTEHEDSLWGVESDAYDYLAETAHDLADEILHRLGKLPEQRRQAWRAALTEAREARYWAQRDVATVGAQP
jgi:hypothetical protein